MAEEISNPLLSLVKEQGLIDDLQYEEVAAELKRSGAPALQLLQDFGIMKLDDILQVMASNLGTEVVSLRDHEFSPDLLKTIPANVARMYHCVPVALNTGLFWPRRGLSIHPGTVTIAFLDAIEPGLDRQSFMKLLEERIETATAELINGALAADPALKRVITKPDIAVS